MFLLEFPSHVRIPPINFHSLNLVTQTAGIAINATDMYPVIDQVG